MNRKSKRLKNRAAAPPKHVGSILVDKNKQPQLAQTG